MNLKVQKTDKLSGSVLIPASKSQTVRALVFATLAEGTSLIKNPLKSSDSEACIDVCRAFGAEIKEIGNDLEVIGTGGQLKTPENKVSVGNSGITGRFTLPFGGLIAGEVVFESEEQLQNRPMQPLIDALNQLGLEVKALKDNGSFPISVKGKLQGGRVEVDGTTSQYLSSLLINCPLADNDTEILVKDLQEQPYVKMTFTWLSSLGIDYQHENMEKFFIKGNQKYQAFERYVPGDFSSASYPTAAALLTDSEVTLLGLDFNDSQGDKRLFEIFKEMGADIDIQPDKVIVRGGKELSGGEFDLNDMPDMLPTLSVVALNASSETVITNVTQARIKETDRIHSMAIELAKMGAKIEEREDGLVIYPSKLTGTEVHGYDDHRTIMALSLAGMIAESGETVIDTAEGIKKTFPNFVELMVGLGAEMEMRE